MHAMTSSGVINNQVSKLNTYKKTVPKVYVTFSFTTGHGEMEVQAGWKDKAE